MADDAAAAPSIHELTAEIVASYVTGNQVAASELPGLIAKVFASLAGVGASPATPAEEPAPKITPAMIRKSVTPDALISFVDGKSYKMLRRHLTTRGYTPESYRAAFGLPKDYPMTAPVYSEMRSQFAKKIGLGARGKGSKPAAAKTRAKRRP